MTEISSAGLRSGTDLVSVVVSPASYMRNNCTKENRVGPAKEHAGFF